jgi:pimeloyl-ACP methyl ester carboxylesterase
MGKNLTRLLLLTSAAWAQTTGLVGTWQGTIDAGALKLRMGLHISKSESGEFSSKVDSIDQNVMGIPVKQTTVSGNTLHLEMPNMNAKYDGTLSADGSEIAGKFIQGAAVPLTFKRVDKIETVSRPQAPKSPFPYDAEDVVYENKTGIKLAGTITFPRGNGPFPVAIMITGSGPQDRDESLMGHKPFLIIADYLTRRGIAVLRVDDRGIGKSTGNSTQTTLDEMAGDVLAGVEYLKGRKEVNAKQIGVIGHSEGGIVGPLAASRSSDIAFVVMLAGTGVTGEQVMYLQSELVIRASGGGQEAINKNHALQEMLFTVLRSEKDEKDEKMVADKIKEAWKKLRPGDPESAIEGEGARVISPEIRSFIFLDPAEALRKLKVPVLALNGSRDVQVPPRQNLPAIVAALAAGGNPDFAAVELPGLNHLFQKCKTCAPSEYGALEETFSPTALEVMGDWLVRHTR